MAWLILTDGSHWQVYRLGRTVPIVVDRAIEVDLLGADQPSKKVDRLFLMTRDGINHGGFEESGRRSAQRLRRVSLAS